MPDDTQLVVCENARGEKIRLPDENSPISIISFDGFGSMDFDVKTSQNSGQDGENYNTSQAQKRNLTITFDIQSDYQRQRDRLHSFFQPRSWGTVYYYETEGGEGRKARYQVESLQIADYGVSRTGTLSLICPDPKFYALTDSLTSFAELQGGITWPLELTNPFEASTVVKELIKTIANDSAVPMGLTITFRAGGTVVNPSMMDVATGKLLKVNTTMHAGDKIVITTGDGNKHVRLTSSGAETNINNLMAYPPVWPQAQPGDNIYRYNADDGIDALSASIKTTQVYWGA
ncbi:MAG: phage tail family protein [Oscillospiraceae bacterium]|jgi:hypothetical protein|nr:phage tail family protein [Oscillospiraceae bacterium]MCI1990002.1 phage tail family protein [Oscillospiraceae bacterium]MCI2034826.1 phage tail family protein [Oscillospiraceae bacterium]